MDSFKQYNYFKYTEDEYKQIWETAYFVFDTSALLNLYRFKSATQKDFLETLKHLESRIWIPHHVALEFNKNRLIVIAEQIALFDKTRKLVKDIDKNFSKELNNLSLKNVHKIDANSILNRITEISNVINAELAKQMDSEVKLRGEDPIEKQLHELFDGKVGNRPATQKELDELESEAEKRFKMKIAPGFQDINKDEICRDSGIFYKKKYSDYVIWRQILDFATTITSKNLIFVTADSAKGDWFLEISANNNHLYQPKPELLDEAFDLGKLDNFLMYDTERFLKFAKEYLNFDISNSSIREVSDIQQFQIFSNTNKNNNLDNLRNNLEYLKLKSKADLNKMEALIEVKNYERQMENEIIRNKGYLDYNHEVLDCPECDLRTMIPNDDSYTGYRCTYCKNEESEEIEENCTICGKNWQNGDLIQIPIDDEGHYELACPYCRRDPDYVKDD